MGEMPKFGNLVGADGRGDSTKRKSDIRMIMQM